jgi:nitrate reductase gamma subunit
MMDLILFGVFPYVAVALAVAVGSYRYLVDRYSWSSHSSQFLESRVLFWGSVPWHYAILLVLLAHLLALVFPGGWGVLLGRPLRLYLLEVTGMALGLCTVIAIVLLIVRRATNPRVATVTTSGRLAGAGPAAAAGGDRRLHRLHPALGRRSGMRTPPPPGSGPC